MGIMGIYWAILKDCEKGDTVVTLIFVFYLSKLSFSRTNCLGSQMKGFFSPKSLPFLFPSHHFSGLPSFEAFKVWISPSGR